MKVIVLCGMMGSGKSTIGKALAKALDTSFLDLDNFVEQKEGTSIDTMFRDKGESYFREVENSCLSEIVLLKKTEILSLGGGSLGDERNRALIKKYATLIYLDVPVQELVNRLKDIDSRPMLSADRNILEDRLNELMKSREQYYLNADFKINGDQSIDDVIQEILKAMYA